MTIQFTLYYYHKSTLYLMTNTLCHPGHPFVIPSVFFVIPSEVEGSVLFLLHNSPFPSRQPE